MLVPVFLLFIWCATAYTPRCTDRSRDMPMTFKPTEDGVVGRYRAELCTRRNPNVTEWSIDLMFYNTVENCMSNRTGRLLPGRQHSLAIVEIEDTNNCTHVCYSTDLDLIFSSCYIIKSTMIIGNIKMPPKDSFHMITNNLTIDSIKNSKPHVNFINHNKEVTLIWYLGIPPTDCRVYLCQTKNATGADIPDACDVGELPDVTRNCTRHESLNELRCAFAPPYGRYYALVEHGAPWVAGVFSGQRFTRYYFTHAAVREPVVNSTGGGGEGAGAAGAAPVWWACGGALALGGAALAALVAHRALRRCAYHKQVLDDWRRQRLESEPSTPTTPAPEPGARPVLLLYAREGERGRRVARRLAELLQHAGGAPVYDVHSAHVGALSAQAPHEWLRAALERPDVRVVLLQTPALAALYRTQLDDADSKLKLVEPLLGRRVVYRAPQFADAMVQYALRLIVLNAYAHHAYHKYYLATLTELSTDILQQVVPYRRYPLPHAAAALLRDLAPPAPAPAPAPACPPHLLQQLEAAVDQFVTHAGEHPDYLMDELLVVANN